MHIFQNPHRRAVFTLLSADPCLDLGSLAQGTGLSKNTVRWHLDVLVKAGWAVRLSKGARHVYYPEGQINGERAALFVTINSPKLGGLFKLIATEPGLFQSQIASKLGRSRQWVSGAIKALEGSGLVTGMTEGQHIRYYPTRLLSDLADAFYKESKAFGDYMMRRLEKEGGAQPAVVKRSLERMIVETGYHKERFHMEIVVNPYLTCLGCVI